MVDSFDVLEGRVPAAIRRAVHHRALMEDADEHVWRRRLELRSRRTGDDWTQHVEHVRRSFRAALGPLPEPAPLRVERTGVLERRAYVVEKLLIQTQPDFYATANLYLPTPMRGKAPAILNAVGHWAHSKAEDLEQARAAGQARKGYVALIWDPLGQGERTQYWGPDGRTPWDASSTTQHAAVCNPAFLIGSTVIATMLWDGVRMLDYLCSRPEVDAGRIGLTGVSGGGTYTTFLGLFDERVKVTVPVCSTSTYERMHRQGQIGEPCQDPMGLLGAHPAGLEMADLLMAHAPRALQISATRYDAFPLAGARETYLDVLDCYAALGIPEKVNFQVVDAHHDYNREQRERAYAWFNRWLEHDAPVAEEPFEPEPESALWCTPTGQVLSSLGGKTAPDLVRELAARTVAAPAPIASATDAERERDRVRSAARRVLGEIPTFTGADPVVLPPATVDRLTVERVILQARMDVPLPALLCSSGATGEPAGGGGTDLVVWLDDRGKAAGCGEGGIVRLLAQEGVPVLAVDLRGWGETAWINERFGWSQDRREVLSADNMLAYVGYMLGQWTVTQRVQDVLGVLRWVRGRWGGAPRRTVLAGHGGGAIVALHAAAVDGGVSGVVLADALATYRSVVDAPRCVQPVADFLPSVLLHYDLPDLAAALAPARVLVLNPQDAMAAPLPPAPAEETFDRAARTARLLGGGVRVETGCDAAGEARHIRQWLLEVKRSDG